MKRWISLLLLSLLLIGCGNGTETTTATTPPSADVVRVGFDIDDTLLFSTPNFTAAQEKFTFGTDEFWAEVNGHDRDYSIVKQKCLEILRQHQEDGAELYAITARPGTGGDPCRDFISETFGIPRENVYFEKPKTARIRSLGLDIFYGDSDSDIEDAQNAGAVGIRIQRSPDSSYRNSDGSLRKYHPGMYGEEIIPDSEE